MSTNPPSPSTDLHGVEVLNAQDLEDHASRRIRLLAPHLLKRPGITPVEAFAQFLADKGLLEYDPSATLTDGVLGKCLFRPVARIEIAEKLDRLRRRFVLAHELGHYALHRKLRVLRRDYVSDDEESIGDVPAKRWMEWQANRFASALLMPQETIAGVIHDAFQEVRFFRQALKFDGAAEYVAAFYDVERAIARRRIREIEKLGATVR